MKSLVEESFNKGRKAEEEGRLEEACMLFKKAVQANSANPEFWLSYLDILVRLGRISEARKVLDRLSEKGIQQGAVRDKWRPIEDTTHADKQRGNR